MTTDVNEIVKNTMSTLTENGEIETMIADATKSSIQKAVSDTLGSWQFQSKIKEAINSAIEIDVEGLGLAGYNVLVGQILKEKLGHFFESTATTSIQKEMDELLAGFPKEIKASELFENFRKYCAEDIGSWESGECTIIVQDDRDDFVYINLDKEPNKDRYRCAYRIGLHNGEVFNLCIDDESPKNKLFFGPGHNFERFLFHAYTNKIKVILDETNPYTSYGRDD
jgi:hypothetical protein